MTTAVQVVVCVAIAIAALVGFVQFMGRRPEANAALGALCLLVAAVAAGGAGIVLATDGDDDSSATEPTTTTETTEPDGTTTEPTTPASSTTGPETSSTEPTTTAPAAITGPTCPGAAAINSAVGRSDGRFTAAIAAPPEEETAMVAQVVVGESIVVSLCRERSGALWYFAFDTDDSLLGQFSPATITASGVDARQQFESGVATFSVSTNRVVVDDPESDEPIVIDVRTVVCDNGQVATLPFGGPSCSDTTVFVWPEA